MNINLNPGIYEAIIYYKSAYSMDYLEVTIHVLPTISGDDLVKYYKNSSQYLLRILDGQEILL